MSIRVITARLEEARTGLRSRVVQRVSAAETALTEAARLIDTVLDEVQDKALARSVTSHAQAIKDGAKAVEVIDRELAATIQRFRSVGGR